MENQIDRHLNGSIVERWILIPKLLLGPSTQAPTRLHRGLAHNQIRWSGWVMKDYWVDSKLLSESKARWLKWNCVKIKSHYTIVLSQGPSRSENQGTTVQSFVVPIQRCEFTTKAVLCGTASLPRVDWMFIYKTILLMAETHFGAVGGVKCVGPNRQRKA